MFSTSLWQELYPYIQTAYQFTYREEKAQDNSEVQSSLQNCEYLIWNLLYVTILPPTIWWCLL